MKNKNTKKIYFILSLLSLVILSTFYNAQTYAATYYIDFDLGSDTNAGTSEDAPWKTIPGTRNTDNTGDQSTCWGGGCPGSATISSSNKVAAGDIFRIKPGTTHSSIDGGMVLIDSDYYVSTATVENPIKFVAYRCWSGASGSVTFDGTGITVGSTTGYGLIHISQLGGIEFDGERTNGFVIQDSTRNGVSAYATSEKEGCSFKYIKFYNNGTLYSSEVSEEGDIHIFYHDGGVVENCEFDGNGNWINGLVLGTQGRHVIDLTVKDCTSHGHHGTDDGGMGFKAFNSQVTFDGCISYDNYKGYDLGEQGGNNRDITYKIVNSKVYDNSFGINMNCAGSVFYTGATFFYIINSIVRDNSRMGSNIYSGPFKLYIVHSIYDNNGTGNPTNRNYANLNVTSDNATSDTSHIEVYLYNNIFYKPAGGSNYLVQAIGSAYDTDYNLDSDYNSWIQRASEGFCTWSWFVGPTQVLFNYGVDGPGHSSGDWYSNEDEPNTGTGHYHCDANSVTTAPPFYDVGSHDYMLTNSYAGTNISSKAWYTSEMGKDRNGVSRTSWNKGAYENLAGGTVKPSFPDNFRFQDDPCP